MSAIQQDFNELQSLHTELTRLRKEVRALQAHRKQCEARILEYLRVNNHPGMRMGNIIVTASEQRVPKRVPRKRQMELLDAHGVPPEIVEKLYKGSPLQRHVLKIKSVQQ